MAKSGVRAAWQDRPAFRCAPCGLQTQQTCLVSLGPVGVYIACDPERMMQQVDERVIVVGAGPVGAVTALALVKRGIPVLLMEAEAEPPEDQRAATIHPPTVEMLA